MIYICIAARNNAATAGLLLWKLRKVFLEYPREYHLLVADDGSKDGTREILETYQRSLPMTLVRHDAPRGQAAALDTLLRAALERSDRPRRDAVVTLPADFSISPAALPELLKRFESGADVVIGEAAPTGSLLSRAVRRVAPWLLRPGISLPGVRDLTSGVSVVRLVTLKSALRERDALFATDGAAVYAELLGRAAATARQIAVVDVLDQGIAPGHAAGQPPLTLAFELFRAGRQVRLPAPTAPVQRP